MSLVRYFKTLLGTVLLLSLLAIALPVIRKTQVSVGDQFEEVMTHEFTIEARPNYFYEISGPRQAMLEKNIRVTGTGSLQLQFAQVKIEPKELSWKENKRRIKASGAEMTTTVRWQAIDAADPHGEIHLTFPAEQPRLRSGNFRMGAKHWILESITVHSSAVSLWMGRLFAGFDLALWPAIFLHSLWVGSVFSRRNDAIVKAAPPADGAPLPRTFLPKPYAEAEAALVWLVILSLLGSIAAGLGIFHGAMLDMLWVINLCIFGIAVLGVAISFMVVPLLLRTVRVGVDRLSISKGRSQTRWMEASWREIRSVEAKERTVKNGKKVWLEVIFPDGKKQKINASSMLEYPTLVQLATALHRSHSTPQAPSSLSTGGDSH